MKRNTSVAIGLHYNDTVIDLQVPNQVTLSRLKELLKESLVLLNIQLPEEFDLILLNKPVSIDPQIKLSHYPIGNGDQLSINQTVKNEEE